MQAHLSWQRSDDKDESDLRPRKDLRYRYLIHPSKDPEPQSTHTPAYLNIADTTPIQAVQYLRQKKMIQRFTIDKPPFLDRKSESNQLHERHITKNSKTFDRKTVRCKTSESTVYLHGGIHLKIYSKFIDLGKIYMNNQENQRFEE